MLRGLLHLHYNPENIWKTSEQSLDQRVWSQKRSLGHLWRGQRSWTALGGVGWGGGVEGAHGSVGDCWKGLRVGRTKCFWNCEAVGIQRMSKMSEVGVRKTLKWLWSGKEVFPWQCLWLALQATCSWSLTVGSYGTWSFIGPTVGAHICNVFTLYQCSHRSQYNFNQIYLISRVF